MGVKKLSKCLVYSVAAVSVSASAVSPRTAEIFRKERRELTPPPRKLRANSENADLRYASGAERVSRKLAADEEGQHDTRSASASLENDDEDEREDTGGAPFRRYKPHARSLFPRRSQGYSGDRTFGLGFLGAGAYGVFGAEVDFGVTRDWSAGFGVGTGMSYSTWGAHGRYYFQNARWSPLVEVGYAQWHLGRAPVDGSPVLPSHLAKILFANGNGRLRESSTAHVVYPGMGVLYQHKSGLAAIAELQYFISATNFTGALFGTMGAYFYF